MENQKGCKSYIYKNSVNRFINGSFFILNPVHDNYIMVLRYANQGHLRDIWKKNFPSFQWKDKIQMALDITCGLQYLHSKKIIHRDLVIIFSDLWLLL